MYTDMEWWTKIRLEVLRRESSKREIFNRYTSHFFSAFYTFPFLGPYRTGRARPWNVGDRSFSSFNVDISKLCESLTFSSLVFMALS